MRSAITNQEPANVAEIGEPTLGSLLTHYARTTVPSRLYVLLQFGIPFALDFGLHGHWRPAAGGIAIAALGGWGLADRWLSARDRADRHTQLMRWARALSGVIATAIPLAMLLALFLRLLGNAPIS